MIVDDDKIIGEKEIKESSCFFFQAEDGIRDLVRSRGLGDVYKRQLLAQIISKSCGT